ncbi:unnamed protein product [Cylindrotheca closterium]|uniref:Dymeclin n=1 Tax=Cylindrotheca closterium TaxID=2856 RepID=A0AAD2FJY7_9STRA|nr:unnamed protein product [Cylindrotheca closterium]
MWGDLERAASLEVGDSLATLLFQVSSPVHIPWGDTRWQELLTGYDVWIHAESIEGDESTSIITQACEMMAKHAFVSSNRKSLMASLESSFSVIHSFAVAAFSLHVTRMIRDLTRDISKSKSKKKEDQTDDFSLRISRVGKARATAGALQLLRLLSHSVVVRCCKDSFGNESRAESNTDLEEAFTYHTRGDLPRDQLASGPLLNAVLDLIVILGKCVDALRTPELYDTIVLAFRLLFVLCGTQLYQDFESSSLRPDEEPRFYSFLDQFFEAAQERNCSCSETSEDYKNLKTFFGPSRDSIPFNSSRERCPEDHIWTAQSVLETCLRWQTARPVAPDRSIAHYYYIMAQSAIAPRSREMRSADGMYESYSIVPAAAPGILDPNEGAPDADAPLSADDIANHHNKSKTQHNLILDATRGVITLGSRIILLPLRLVSRVFGALVQSKGSFNRDLKSIMSRKFDSSTASRTKDVLWLSDAILADLSSCLVLLLINNNRSRENPFREELQALSDNRWDHGMESRLPDLPSLDTNSSSGSPSTDISRIEKGSDLRQIGLTLNFESLFESFGRTLHTEVGSLLLYTLVQTSESFAESLAVRSDLDTLVLPLLRTLYFSSQSNTFMASDYAAHKKKGSTNILNIRNCPFRSQSQLYVIIILLLLFSQDLSFGRDAFRRIHVPHVVWYKERQLRHINLGSVLFLTLLRSLIFNLQRLHDPFMLSNCCAILSNLSSATTDLHEYAAMRLVSVAISVMKRHSKLIASTTNGGQDMNDGEEDDLSTPLGRYSEVANNLLSIISDCLSHRRIEQNLQVIYAIVYHQADFTNVFKGNMYPARQTERILSIAQAASTLIQEASARSAPKALKVLESQVEVLRSVVDKKRRKRDSISDYTFTYEEDADPESFFVPYVWEVIVCVVTSSSIEWKKNNIRAFPLLEPEEKAGVQQQPRNGAMVSDSFDTDAEDFV